MVKYIIYFILSASTYSFCFSQNDSNKCQNDCYSYQIRLNIKEKEFKDTVVMLRNYVNETDDKRIICNSVTVEDNINKLVWECKYIETYLTYQNKQNKFSILSYSIDNQSNIIASYFLSNRKTKETIEMMRFKIFNDRIVGINIFPNIYDDFVPIEEYDKPKIMNF